MCIREIYFDTLFYLAAPRISFSLWQMSIPKCQLGCHSVSPHLQQLYTGFSMLHAAGRIELSQRLIKNRTIRYASDAEHLRDAGHAHLDAVVGGEIKLHFDTHDAGEIAIGELETCDYYFKRSFSRAWVDCVPPKQRSKVLPLGLNYRVYSSHVDRFALRRSMLLNTGVRSKAAGLKRALDVRNRLGFHPRLEDIEAPPDHEAAPKILFLAATHDPRNDPERSPEKVEERREINEARAQCIRLLRRALGDRFLGGFSQNAFSLRHYPDLVIANRDMTTQASYVEIMKRHTICIATTGLHGSTGWKLAEYVACSRAILSEPLLFEVPGEFSEGRNYLLFTSPEECVERAQELISNKELRSRLMTNNALYYQSYVRPDSLVHNALATAMSASAAMCTALQPVESSSRRA
jgi:hypothetical protein